MLRLIAVVVPVDAMKVAASVAMMAVTTSTVMSAIARRRELRRNRAVANLISDENSILLRMVIPLNTS